MPERQNRTVYTPFISDLGEELFVTRGDGVKTSLGRYGVWVRGPLDRKHNVVKTGNDLKALQAEFSIPDSEVLRIKAPSA